MIIFFTVLRTHKYAHIFLKILISIGAQLTLEPDFWTENQGTFESSTPSSKEYIMEMFAGIVVRLK